MFAFSQIEPRRQGRVSEMHVPAGRLLETQFKQGMTESAFGSIYRMSEMYFERHESMLWGMIQWDNGEEISPEEASKRAKALNLPLTFDEPVFEGEFNLLVERKQMEMERRAIIDQGMRGVGRFAGGMGAYMIGNMLNPIDFGLMFVPVVGTGSKSANILGRGARIRSALGHGIVQRETLQAKFGRGARVVESGIEGTVGAAIAEIPLAISNYQSQAEYGMADFALGVAGGAAFTVALREGLQAAARVYNMTTKKTREATFRRAIDQFVKGEDIQVHQYVELDENVLRQQAVFDVVEARRRAKETVGSIDDFEPEARKELEPTLNPFQKLLVGKTLYHRSHEPNIAEIVEKGEFRAANERKKMFFVPSQHGSEKWYGDYGEHIFTLNDISSLATAEIDWYDVFTAPDLIAFFNKNREKFSGRFRELLDSQSKDPDFEYLDPFEHPDRIEEIFQTVKVDELADALANHPEIVDQLPIQVDIPTKNKIDNFSASEVRKRARQLRERKIKQLIREEQKKFDPEQKFRELVDQEIKRQQEQGRILSPEQIEKYGIENDDKGLAAVTEDIENLKKQLDPEDFESIERLESPIDDEAVRAATNCIIVNG